MYKTQAEAMDFLQEFLSHLEQMAEEREIILCVPYTDLGILSKALHGTRIMLGAQNVHWEVEGAYTGEVSALMLAEYGVRYVVIGHSERRQYFGETDETVNMRLVCAQKHGLTPILCVGETREQRQSGQTEALIKGQIRQGLRNADQQNLVIAYEPIWAIGTGETCESMEANRVIELIRQELDNPNASILYGGSVKPGNIDEIMAQPAIDGVLVGGASLSAAGFSRIVNYEPVSV